MQSRRFNMTFGHQLLRLLASMLFFVIVCGGFVTVSISAQYYGNTDDIVFPGPISSSQRRRIAVGNETQIPLGIASRINAINTQEEFLQMLQNIPEHEKRLMIGNRFGDGEERSNVLQPMPAKCIPEMQVVPLHIENNYTSIVYPSCMRLMRCGGCCTSSLLSCQPTASETRNIEVIVSTVSLSYRGRQIVPVEEHTACKCDCIMKEKDCNEKQHYEAESCTCTCNNIDEADKCMQNSDIKIWDPDTCACSCRNIEPCNTGFFFDHNTCRCRQITFITQQNKFASMKGSNYGFDNTRQNVPPVIIPLDPSDSRRKHKEDPEY